MDDNWREDRVNAALRGRNPTVLRRMRAGFAVIGDNQYLPGYCLLLTDDPLANRLTDLPRQRRLEFLADMDLLGEAVERVCVRRDPAFRRINYEILGNQDAFLHAHVRPRYEWEPAEMRNRPVAAYPSREWDGLAQPLGERHDDLRAELVAELAALEAESMAGSRGRHAG